MHSIRFCGTGVEDKTGSVAAAGEHFQPLVECGPLWLEEDVPFLKQAEAALLVGGVVAVPPCQDGPGDVVGDVLHAT